MKIDEILLSDNTLFNYIGYAAALATVLTFTIQILKIIESKKVTNLSSYMYIIYTLSLICWATYGIFIENWLIVFANLIAFPFTFTILLLILYYDAEDKIERARRDSLTYAFNRQYFTQTVPVKIAQSKTQQQPFSIMSILVNNYAETKQKLNEKNADKLLKAAAKFLEKNLRENDIVARFENNHFVAFLSEADAKSAESVAKRLSKNAENIKVKLDANNEQSLNLSIGVATGNNSDDMDGLLQKSAKALNIATEPKKVTTSAKPKVSAKTEAPVKKAPAKLKLQQKPKAKSQAKPKK